jgi:CrcB protein
LHFPRRQQAVFHGQPALAVRADVHLLFVAYLVGMCIAVFQTLPHLDPVWRLLLITGFLGGLTTFSSFSAEVVNFLMEGRYGLALGTAALHVLGSLILTVAGIKSALFFIAARAH